MRPGVTSRTRKKQVCPCLTLCTPPTCSCVFVRAVLSKKKKKKKKKGAQEGGMVWRGDAREDGCQGCWEEIHMLRSGKAVHTKRGRGKWK